MRKYLLLVGLLALVLSACRIESNVIMNIEEDGSAEVAVEIGFDEQFLQFMTEAGGSPDDLFTDLPEFADGEGVLTERVDGDMTYYGFATQVEDITTYDPNEDAEGTFSTFEVTVDDSSARVDAELVATDLEGMAGEFPMDPGQITDDFFSANLIVHMPGSVTEHDADQVRDDGALVWEIPLTGSRSVNAVSEFGGASSNLILIILVAILLIGIIAAVVATVVSRRESQKAVEAAAVSQAAPPAPPVPEETSEPEIESEPSIEEAAPETPSIDETIELEQTDAVTDDPDDSSDESHDDGSETDENREG